MAKLIDQTYGDAFFELSLEEDKVDEYADEIRALKTLLEMEPHFMELLNHPRISQQEKITMLEECFDGRVSDEVSHFLKVIVEARRQNMLIAIFDHYLKRVRKYNHIGKAYVVTAVELTEDQKADIEKRLIETTDNTSYEIEFIIEPRVLGGMRIRIDDVVVDGTIIHHLHTMTRKLENIQLA